MNRRLIRGFALVILFLVGVVGTRGYVTSFFFFFVINYSFLLAYYFRICFDYLITIYQIYQVYL